MGGKQRTRVAQRRVTVHRKVAEPSGPTPQATVGGGASAASFGSGLLSPAGILALQRTAGNAAVNYLLRQLAAPSSAPGRSSVSSPGESVPAAWRASSLQRVPAVGSAVPVQRKREKKADLLEMTVSAFNSQRKAEQMDWANDPAFTELERGIVWAIIDWGLGGLAQIKLKDIVDDVKTNPQTMQQLRQYCAAIVGESPTVQLVAVDTLAAAKKQGEWVSKLNSAMGGPLVRATVPLPVFNDLIEDPAFAKKWIDYYAACNPIVATPTGREITAFLELVKDEGATVPGDYKAALPTIRNYHKFMKASLDKLKTDKGKKDKPLTLILHAGYDHNGAFHRHAHVNKVIQNTNIVVLLYEALEVSALEALGKTGLAKLAASNGMNGKLTQVMLAGHGNSTFMEMGGGKTDVKEKEGQYTVSETGRTDLGFFNESYDTFWTEFFEALFKNMAAEGGLQPKVLLRACLTNSNEVNTTKLKEQLKKESGLDVNDKSIDPTTPENQGKIRAGITEYIKRNGSLATLLTDRAKGRAKVLGANASISSATAGSIHEDTGALDIIALGDPKVAAPKLEYVRYGKEPLGALKAVIEAWATDDAACFKEMEERVAELAASANDTIIQLLYRTILAQYKTDILAANGLVGSASALESVAKGGAECRATSLHKDSMIQKHLAAFYPVLIPVVPKAAKMVIYEDWMQADSAKRENFANVLADPGFTRNSALEFLDFALLGSYMAGIFTSGAADRGKLLLALIGLIKDGRADCKDYLLTLVTDGKLPDSIKNELLGYSEDTLRGKLGLPVEVQAPLASSGLPNKRPMNAVAVKGVNKAHVEPLPAMIKDVDKAGLFDHAKLRTAPSDDAELLDSFYYTRKYTVVGELKNSAGKEMGWYMVRLDSGTVAYMRKKYF